MGHIGIYLPLRQIGLAALCGILVVMGGSQVSARDDRQQTPPATPSAELITVQTASKLQATKRLSGHSGTVYSVSYNADGTRLVSAGADKTARVWGVASGWGKRIAS